MADFPTTGLSDPETLGTVLNKLELAPSTRRSALGGFISAAKPYTDESLSATLQTTGFTPTSTDPFRQSWDLLQSRIDVAQAQDDSEIAQRIAALSNASEAYSNIFFGSTSLSKTERDDLLAQLVAIFNDPRSAITTVGDRNASRSATRALMDAEITRATAFLGSEYAVPASAIATRHDRAMNIVNKLNETALTALERKFLAFDDSLQGEYMQARVQAMRALYGEPAAAYATSLAFASQVVVPAYARGQVNQARADDFMTKFAKIYESGFTLAADGTVLAQQRAVDMLKNNTETWKNRHELKNQTFSEASTAVAAAAQEVSKQLSAALNAVSGSGGISDSFSRSDRYPTINIENGIIV